MDIIPKKFYLDDLFDSIMMKGNDNLKCDIYEKNGIYHIELDTPGYKKEDIEIEAKNGYLTISAKKSTIEESNDKSYIRRERTYNMYSRSIYIGDIDTNSIKAQLKDGILKITVPKQEKIDNKTLIQIND